MASFGYVSESPADNAQGDYRETRGGRKVSVCPASGGSSEGGEGQDRRHIGWTDWSGELRTEK